MANIYNNTDNLYWVYTAYGKERLSSLQTNDLLKLYNIKIGSYDWYEDPRSILGGTYSEAAFKAYFQSGEDRRIVIHNKYCSVFHLFVFCYIFCLQKYTFFLK